MSKTTDKVTTFSVANATNSAVDLSVSNQFDYGISAEYQRSNYDSPTARKDFLDSQFQDSKTTISKDGQTVHRSHEAAKNKYGAKRASYHQAEADHKDPLKNIQERTEKNPVLRSLLTDQDIEEVGNRTCQQRRSERNPTRYGDSRCKACSGGSADTSSNRLAAC